MAIGLAFERFLSSPNSESTTTENHIYMVISPWWYHFIILVGLSYQLRWAAVQRPTKTVISGVRIATTALRMCYLTSCACGL